MRKLLLLSLVVGIATAIVGLASALFTDSETVTDNAFTTGTIDLSTDVASALVTFTNMAPGDSVVAPLTVSNDGSLALRYSISSTVTSDFLAAQLDLTIKEAATTNDCTSGNWDSLVDVVYATGGLGTQAGVSLVGDPAAGADAGDRDLAASGSEVLCFRVDLPLATDNTYQNETTTATFAFLAEQTANND